MTAAGPGPVAVVVTYNSASHVEACLSALASSGIHDVVVLDNASSDDTRARLHRYTPAPRIVLSEVNLGFAAGVNEAVSAVAPGRDLLLVNPDCVTTPEAVASLRSLMRQHPEVGVCAPAMVYADGRRGISGGPRPTLLKEVLAATGVHDRLPDDVRRVIVDLLVRTGRARSLTGYLVSLTDTGPVPVTWVSGFCMYVRRSCWDAVGGLDDRMFMYFEDVALCLAARTAGWDVMCDTRVTVRHDESASSTVRGKSRLYRSGMWSFFRWHGTPVQRTAARCGGRT